MPRPSISSYGTQVHTTSPGPAVGPQGGDEPGEIDAAAIPDEFRDAMDDDLNTAGALAVVHARVRAGNTALDEGDTDSARQAAREVRAMTAVLGVDPMDAQWTSGGGGSDAADALGSLVEEQLAERAAARRARDFATADRIRDRLKAAGIAVEDTAGGARWSLARESE